MTEVSDATRRESLPVLRLGETLNGRYRLIAELGRGGMGIVYAADHVPLGRRVAVKVLSVELATDEHWKKRFKREAQLLDELRSEHIVDVLDFDETADNVQFLVMELLEGEDLKHLLSRERQLSVGRAASIVLQACRGLANAHRSGVTHRDLKPKNLFICAREAGTDLVKILDFGVARRPAGSDSASSTRAGAILGTFRYMPPEQIRGAEDLGPTADVYSLGAILYEMLAGKVPFSAEEPHVLMHQILYEVPAPLGSLRADLTDTVTALVHRALSREPDERFSNADEFSAALREAIGSTARGPGAPLSDADRTSSVAALPSVALGPTPRSSTRARIGTLVLLLSSAWLAFAVGRWSAMRSVVAVAPPPVSRAVDTHGEHRSAATSSRRLVEQSVPAASSRSVAPSDLPVPAPLAASTDRPSGAPKTSRSSRKPAPTVSSSASGQSGGARTPTGVAASAFGFDTQNPYAVP